MVTQGRWFLSSGKKLPMGIIIPFNGNAADIPADWEQFVVGNRSIMGAVSNANQTGGQTGVARGCPGAGNHTGSGASWWAHRSAGSVADRVYTGGVGHHAHSTVTVSYYPARAFHVLIKSLKENMPIPVNGGILHDNDLSALATDISNDGYLLGGTNGSSLSLNGSSSSVSGANATGAHNHLSGVSVSAGGANAYATQYSMGNHGHSVSRSVTDQIRRYYMGLWANASKDMKPVPGMYGMFESEAAPPGWAICDGNNNTPDLTNYFIGLTTDSGKKTTKTGNGTISTTVSWSTSGSHNHQAGWAYRNVTDTGYHANNVSHSHSAGWAASSFSPLYHTLIFIKLIEGA